MRVELWQLTQKSIIPGRRKCNRGLNIMLIYQWLFCSCGLQMPPSLSFPSHPLSVLDYPQPPPLLPSKLNCSLLCVYGIGICALFFSFFYFASADRIIIRQKSYTEKKPKRKQNRNEEWRDKEVVKPKQRGLEVEGADERGERKDTTTKRKKKGVYRHKYSESRSSLLHSHGLSPLFSFSLKLLVWLNCANRGRGEALCAFLTTWNHSWFKKFKYEGGQLGRKV